MPVPIRVPADLDFESLQLAIDHTGVHFRMDVIMQLLNANGLSTEVFKGSDASLAGLIEAWYECERAQGSPRSPVVQRLICGAGARKDEFAVTLLR